MIRSNIYEQIKYYRKSFHLTSRVEYSLVVSPKKKDVCPERVLDLSREILYRYFHSWIVIELLPSL